MAKKQKQKKGGQQQFLSPEKFLKTRARSLKIGKCYCAVNLFEIGVGYVLVPENIQAVRLVMHAISLRPFT